jgi:hypothetical protein
MSKNSAPSHRPTPTNRPSISPLSFCPKPPIRRNFTTLLQLVSLPSNENAIFMTRQPLFFTGNRVLPEIDGGLCPPHVAAGRMPAATNARRGIYSPTGVSPRAQVRREGAPNNSRGGCAPREPTASLRRSRSVPRAQRVENVSQPSLAARVIAD